MPTLVAAQRQYDIIIRNGKIIDGTGNNWYYGDVGIVNGRILSIRTHITDSASQILDASGLVIAPGFIDVHSHIEGGIFENPTADNFLHDGVTTVVTGNCGGSEVDITGFFRRLDSTHVSLNVATLIGHNSVRALIMGRDDRQPSNEELKQMQLLVEKAMTEGAVGFSTGLIYVPGTYAKTSEVVALAQSSSKYGGVYASHIRNEESNVAEAIEEAIDVGRQAKMPVEISHFKVGGKANWGRSDETLGIVEKARREGLDVTIDQYPYTASSTNLGARLPSWAIAGTQDSINARLKDPTLRSKIIRQMLEEIRRYKFTDFSFAVVASYRADSTLNGKTISEINKMRGRKIRAADEAETILDMMEKGGAQMIYHTMNETDVRNILKYPFNMAGADAGVIVFGKGMPHPRGYGTNARILGLYVRDQHLISLEDAIRRMTSLAAQKFHLSDRGLLKQGYAADIVVFDEKTIIDHATFAQPHQYSTGFRYVLVNGKLVIRDDQHTGARSGVPLYGPAFNDR